MKRTSEVLAAVMYGLLGWVIAAAPTTIALWTSSSPNTALSAHAVVIPVAFLLASTVYFRRPRPLGPLATALVFAGVAIVMDVVIASALGRDLGVRALLLSSILPATAAFAATWMVGTVSSIAQHAGR